MSNINSITLIGLIPMTMPDKLKTLLEQAIRRGVAFATRNIEENKSTMVMDREGTHLCINAYISDGNEILTLNEYVNTFKSLCETYQLSSLHPTNPEIFAEKIDLSDNFCKYHFYIQPNELHTILMNEWEQYARYRDGDSLLRIHRPQDSIVKKNIICLFPAQEIDEKTVIMRNAGCNITNTIFYQLEAIFKPLFSDVSGEIFQHNQSSFLNNLGIDDERVYEAIQSLFKIEAEIFNHQTISGDIPISLNTEINKIIKPMNEDALFIYNNFSAEMPQNLPHCLSVEIPTLVLLNEMLKQYDKQIENNINQAEQLNKKHAELLLKNPLETEVRLILRSIKTNQESQERLQASKEKLMATNMILIASIIPKPSTKNTFFQSSSSSSSQTDDMIATTNFKQ